VARHAGVDAAKLRLLAKEGGVVLRVEDRGKGMPPGARNGTGLGLPGLAERLRAVQGTLTIDSTPGGTTLEAWVPDEGETA